MDCQECSLPNRQIAKYCKRCGQPMALAARMEEFGGQFSELNTLVGLIDLKDQIKKRVTSAVNMAKAGFPQDLKSLSTILIGDTGTGKSKVAQVLGAVYHQNRITKTADVKIVSAADFPLFCEKLNANMDAAKGAILLIDHVHQLVPAGYVPGQGTLIDKLYAEMEKRDGDPITIITSKEEGFRDYLRANHEVNNRFNLKFYLPGLSLDQMCELAELLLKEKKFFLSADFSVKLRKRMHYLFKNQSDHEQSVQIGKAGFLVNREIHNIVSDHFLNPDPGADLLKLLPGDITGQIYESKTADDILTELDSFVGMDQVKVFVRQLVDYLSIQQRDINNGGKESSLSNHIVLSGNPGTGKTTLARKLGEVFAASGVLSSGHVIETDRSKLVGQYVGETPLLVQKYCDQAMGGILFIDEAYALKQDSQDNQGQQVIDTLIKRMEDDRGNFIVVAAGYQKEMASFIDANPGMKSRMAHFFHLPDYNPDELLEILKIFLSQGRYQLTPTAELRAYKQLETLYQSRTTNFGNGRDVRNLRDQILVRRAGRIASDLSDSHDLLIQPEDIPAQSIDLSSQGLENILSELNSYIGLREVKNEITTLVDYIEANRLREAAGRKGAAPVLHFIFSGAPGTGKNTVARLLAKIFQYLGLLPTDKLIEVTDKDLIGEYVGHTSIKTNLLIDRAMGGVLFIDEAYTLAADGKGNDSFKKDAVTALLKRMEDDRGKFIVIAAGYEKEMEDFIDSNPGLDSRFTKKISFKDFEPSELNEILITMMTDAGFILEPSAIEQVSKHVQLLYQRRDKRFANARSMRIEFEKIVNLQSGRLTRAKRNNITCDPLLILAEDIPGYERVQAQNSDQTTADALKDLHALSGLAAVKDEIDGLINHIVIEAMRAKTGSVDTVMSLHFLFKGRPGTGKTTVARLLGKIFKAMGILLSGHVIETERKDLVGEYVGQTAPKTSAIIDRALGGILFIDEAYTLIPKDAQFDFGKEAVDTLLKRMEDDKGKFIVIAAGYPSDMDRLIASNDGLASRFTKEITFEDFLPQELLDIFNSMLSVKGMHISEESSKPIYQYFSTLYQNRDERFANGRTVRNLFERALQKQATRLGADLKNSKDISHQLFEILPEDVI